MTKRSSGRPAQPGWVYWDPTAAQWIAPANTVLRWRTWLLTKGAREQFRCSFDLHVLNIRARGLDVWRACNVPGAE